MAFSLGGSDLCTLTNCHISPLLFIPLINQRYQSSKFRDLFYLLLDLDLTLSCSLHSPDGRLSLVKCSSFLKIEVTLILLFLVC
jgi:hypothetical protein